MIMKNLLLIPIIIMTSLIAQASTSSDEWRVSGRLNAYIQYIDVDGNGSTSPEGTTHNEELNLNFAGGLGSGKAGVETRVRNTNDDRIQQNRTELLYLRSYYQDKMWGVELGDVAMSLNPYIYSSSVKGMKAVYKSQEKKRALSYSIIGGVKKASWSELYENQENETPDGYSSAFEMKYVHERAKEISLSLSASKENVDDVNSSVNGKKGLGIGIDGKWRFNKYITLKGRGALTDGTDDVRNNADNRSRGAIYLKLLTRPVLKSVKSNFVYQRVSTGFISFGGYANDDKEQLENSTTWRINNQLRARMDLKGNRDNLDGSLGETQNLHYEALSLNYRPEFIKRGDIDLRASNKGLKGRDADTTTQTAGININVRQKSGLRYGAGYDYSDINDKNTTTNSSTTHTFKALVAYKQKLSKTSSYRFSIKPNYMFINHKQDKAGINLDAGYIYDKLSMDLLYLTYRTEYDDTVTNATQNSTYQFRTAYKLNETGRDVVKFLLEKRDVNVDNQAANTYSEYRGRLSLVMNF